MSSPEEPITLSQIYFYIVIVLFVLIAMFFISSSEDLKNPKRYKKYIKFSLAIGTIGMLIELLGWNYLCPFQCILFAFSPLITLIVHKVTVYFFKKMSNKEPYEIHKGKLVDGIWQKNKGNLRHKNYYMLYSVAINVIPYITIILLFFFIKEHTC